MATWPLFVLNLDSTARQKNFKKSGHRSSRKGFGTGKTIIFHTDDCIAMWAAYILFTNTTLKQNDTPIVTSKLCYQSQFLILTVISASVTNLGGHVAY